jgi:hypothetical protein
MRNPEGEILTNEFPDHETQLRHLKWSLQALAASASEQLALFPDAVAKADELALDFDNCAAVVRGRDDSELSESQLAALTAIDDQLATMSRLATELDADMWSEAALRHDQNWEQIRQLAADALKAFGWAAENPAVAE